jgi:hypothetical protein
VVCLREGGPVAGSRFPQAVPDQRIDPVVESAEAERVPEDAAGDRQPHLRTVGNGTLAGSQHCIRARVAA